MSRRRDKRALQDVAERYGFVFEDFTAKGHLKWRHRETGVIVHSVSTIGCVRGLKNAETNFRRALQEIESGQPHRYQIAGR